MPVEDDMDAAKGDGVASVPAACARPKARPSIACCWLVASAALSCACSETLSKGDESISPSPPTAVEISEPTAAANDPTATPKKPPVRAETTEGEAASASAEAASELETDDRYVLLPSDPRLESLDRAAALEDAKAGDFIYYYWGNIVMLPKDFPERAERAGLTIYVVPECCRSIPPDLDAYNTAIEEAYDAKHGAGSFAAVLRAMMVDFMKQAAPP